MIWQSPQALWLLLAVPVVVGIFLYRRMFPLVQVPSLGAWSNIGTPVVRSNWRNWLRRILILLFQLLLIAIVITAGAGPLDRAPPRADVIIVLDVSATMLSRASSGATRFELAKDQARQILVSCTGDPRLILSSDVPTIANTPGKPLGDILHELQPEPVDGSLDQSLDLAQSLSTTMADPQIVVISDFVSQTPERLTSNWRGKAPLRLIQVGDDLAEAGFVSAQIVPGENGQARVQGQIAAHGFAGASHNINVHVQAQTVGSGSVALRDGVNNFDFPAILPAGNSGTQIIELSLDCNDALGINNHLSLLLSPAKRRIGLISAGPSALKDLIQASGNVEVQEFTGSSSLRDAKVDLFVVDHKALPPGSLPPNGAFLFVDCTDPFQWLRSRATATAGVPSSWEPSHPLLNDLFPEALRAPTALVPILDAGVKTSTVLEAGSVPLIVDLRTTRGSAHAVYLLFDPYASPAGATLAFPLLILNCLDYLAPPGANNSAYDTTGNMPVVGAAGDEVRVIGPDGRVIALSNSGHELRTSRLIQTGHYLVQRHDGNSILPVNYLSSRAADPMPRIPAATNQIRPRWPSMTPAAALFWAAISLGVLETFLLAFGRMRI